MQLSLLVLCWKSTLTVILPQIKKKKRDHFKMLATGVPKLKTWLGTQRVKKFFYLLIFARIFPQTFAKPIGKLNMALLCSKGKHNLLRVLPWTKKKKKKNHRGNASCDKRICSLISPWCIAIDAWSRGGRKSRSRAVPQLNQAPWFLNITRFWLYA